MVTSWGVVSKTFGAGLNPASDQAKIIQLRPHEKDGGTPKGAGLRAAVTATLGGEEQDDLVRSGKQGPINPQL